MKDNKLGLSVTSVTSVAMSINTAKNCSLLEYIFNLSRIRGETEVYYL